MVTTQRCGGVTAVTTAVLLFVLMTAIGQPTGTAAASLKQQSSLVESSGSAAVATLVDLSADASAVDGRPSTKVRSKRTPLKLEPSTVLPAKVRRKRTLLKLKPLIVLPAKVALGAGAKLVAGAKLGAKAVGLGAKALGVGAVGLKAVKKVAKVTVKAATALGVKAVLLNFLFQKINQIIDFKTRLLGNLDQRNRAQNAQFLAVTGTSSKGSVGSKEDDDFLSGTTSDQQGLAQEQSTKNTGIAALVPDDEVTFDANKVSLQVPDRLFGPSFTAVNGISQAIGTVIQNAATRLARLVNAVKTAIFRKVSGVSSLSNSSGRFGSSAGSTDDGTGTRGLRDAADDLDSFPLDDVSPAESKAVNGGSSSSSSISSNGTAAKA